MRVLFVWYKKDSILCLMQEESEKCRHSLHVKTQKEIYVENDDSQVMGMDDNAVNRD